VRLVLASGSPRRRELLGFLGLPFDAVAPDVDESLLAGEAPETYVARLARTKAVAVGGDVVLAADTTVVLDGEIFAKPTDGRDAARMLRALSGATHEVLTGVAVHRGSALVTHVERTFVTFVAMSDADVAWYVGTGEPLDKAGAYAVQGAGGRFVARVDGSPSNVVGLPLHALEPMLRHVGVGLGDLR
jgi:septum formation protein